MANVTHKACCQCGLVKPADQFSPDRRASSGMQSRCRPCARGLRKAQRDANIEESRARERAYVQANKERVYARNSEYRARHPEKVKAAKKAAYEAVRLDPDFLARRNAYAAANKERKREYDKAYRAAKGSEAQLARARAWRKANPEKRAAIVRNYRDRRRQQTEGGVSTADLAEWTAKQKKNCYWCGTRCANGFHIDHYVPLSKGGKHELGNLVIACAPCNLRKNAKDPLAFAQEVGRLL